MKIYTKKGDGGETGLIGGRRVSKRDLRIRAYGEVDEVNAMIGWARSLGSEKRVDDSLERIQEALFEVGAVLANPGANPGATPGATREVTGGALRGSPTGRLEERETQFLEGEIDRMERELTPLKNFILPGGTAIAAALQVARAVTRRAEREVVALSEEETVPAEVLVYLNRLSDYLFVLARWVNQAAGARETPWRGRGR